ncbi:hypothetical protein PACTADRAFT_48347 [Pachysolen tannophilus NRRL Y-2460]|uniref:Nucleolar complex protein 2 n=1 Tax=Pachysolen tannophilus NRRL Y-2460 TaxID=669874 RepID=A0A1E4U3Q8_PACTA|nr:hypothetical protein PACTADRAFT_48347 [Pachysolen tannophilus NRRL Y-2460]
MGKASKATKKFQSKHLKHTLDHRKEVQKHNKLKGNRKFGSKSKSSSGSSDSTSVAKEKKNDEIFKDMNVEEFFAGGFDVPKAKKSNKSKREEKEDEADEDEEESSEEEFEQDMDKLEEQDPDFYKYLKENDKQLLDFKPVNPLDAIDSEDEDEEDEEEEEEYKQDQQKDDEIQESFNKIEVTLESVKLWEKNLSSSKPDMKILKNVSSAFKAAVNINNGNDDYKYSVTDEDAFNQLMLLTLKKLPIAIQTIVPYKKNSNGVRSLPSSKQMDKKINAIANILKSHSGSLLTLLNDITNTETAALILSSLQEILPYYLSQRKLIKKLFNSIIDIWSTTQDVDTQIATFAFLNNVSREFPKSILEIVLRSTYATFIKNARSMNIHTDANINFQKNSATELFGINETLSYQVGFESIRQLAIHLRNSINNPTKDSYKIIYNWQYCHSLDFWSRVLSKYCNSNQETKNNESPLKQLIYPLVQVTIGTIRLLPTSQFYPLRFYLIRSLIRLSQNTGVFIPLFPLLSEILTSTAFTKNPKPDSKKKNSQQQPLQAVDFDHNIKVNAAYLNTRIYQDGLCAQFIELIAEFFVLYSKNISFPELVTPPVIILRRYIKNSKNIKFNKQLSNLIEKLNANSKFITEKRSHVEFGPNNRAEVNRFLSDLNWQDTPLGKYVVVQREVKEEKNRILRESALADEEERKNKKEQKDEDDIVMSDASEEEDDEEEEQEDEDEDEE